MAVGPLMLSGLQIHLANHHDVDADVAEKRSVTELAIAHGGLHGLGILHMVTIRQPRTHQHVFGKSVRSSASPQP